MATLAPADKQTPVPYGVEALNANGCRNLIAAVLWQGCYDASVGQPDAVAWLRGEYSAHLAGLLDIDAWPPSAKALARIRASKAHIRNGRSR